MQSDANGTAHGFCRATWHRLGKDQGWSDDAFWPLLSRLEAALFRAKAGG